LKELLEGLNGGGEIHEEDAIGPVDGCGEGLGLGEVAEYDLDAVAPECDLGGSAGEDADLLALREELIDDVAAYIACCSGYEIHGVAPFSECDGLGLQAVDAWNNASTGNTLLQYGNNGGVGHYWQGAMTDLNELQFFVQVSKAQSFTRAARRMGVPRSSVSRAIGRLEARLGVRLVERTTRSVALTEAGALYLDHCQRVMEEAEQADLAMGVLLAKPRGRLWVAAPLPFIRFELVPLLGEFLAEYPELRVSVEALSVEKVAREGTPDVMIWPGPLQDSGLLMKPLAEVRLGAYASPLYLERAASMGASPITVPADLLVHSCVTSGCGTHGEPMDSAVWRLRRGAEMKEVRVEARVAVPDPSITHQLTVAGLGVGVLGHSMARADVEAGRLVRLLPEWEPEPMLLHALYPTRLGSSPKVRAFLDFLRARMGKKF